MAAFDQQQRRINCSRVSRVPCEPRRQLTLETLGDFPTVIIHLAIVLFAIFCFCAAIAVVVQRRLPWRSGSHSLSLLHSLTWFFSLIFLGLGSWLAVALVGSVMFP